MSLLSDVIRGRREPPVCHTHSLIRNNNFEDSEPPRQTRTVHLVGRTDDVEVSDTDFSQFAGCSGPRHHTAKRVRAVVSRRSSTVGFVVLTGRGSFLPVSLRFINFLVNSILDVRDSHCRLEKESYVHGNQSSIATVLQYAGHAFMYTCPALT